LALMERGSRPSSSAHQAAFSVNAPSNVRYWYKADIGLCDCGIQYPLPSKIILLSVVARLLHQTIRSEAKLLADDFSKSEGIMLQTDITILKRRKKILEKEIDDALSHARIDDPMIAHLKSRILYVNEEIDRLRHEAFVQYH